MQNNIDPYADVNHPDDFEYIDTYATPDTKEGDGFDYDENEYYYTLPDEIPETGFTPEMILKAIVTPEGNRRPRAVIGCVHSLEHESLKEPQKQSEYLFENALVTVDRRHDIVSIGLEFPEEYDDNLKKVWNQLNNYGDDLNRYVDIETSDARFDIFIMPKNNMNASLCAANPFFWTLRIPEVGGTPVQIAMLFREKDIDFTVNSLEYSDVERETMDDINARTEALEAENIALEEELKKSDKKSKYSMADDFENIVPGEDMVYDFHNEDPYKKKNE